MDTGLVIAMVATAVAVGYIVFVVGVRMQDERRRSTRRLSGLQTQESVMQQPFSQRVIIPAVKRVGQIGLRLSPQAWASRTRTRLVRAGWYPGVDEVTWAAVRVFAIVIGIVGYIVVSRWTDGLQQMLLLGVCVLGGVLGPDQILNRRAEERVTSIERDLPDIIDLMVISIEAGLGFEAALDRVVRHVPGVLSDEFGRMLQETRVGVSRHEAMKALAARTDVDDLNSFILAINQADSFGVSIGRMLRVQAEEMRVRRRQRSQERAFAAPVKMVFPLVLCVFPAMFLVLVGPAAINVLENLA